MSLSTDLEVKHIVDFANLLVKQVELKEKLSCIFDELVNLSCCMSREDIKEAELLFEKKMEGDDLYGCVGSNN